MVSVLLMSGKLRSSLLNEVSQVMKLHLIKSIYKGLLILKNFMAVLIKVYALKINSMTQICPKRTTSWEVGARIKLTNSGEVDQTFTAVTPLMALLSTDDYTMSKDELLVLSFFSFEFRLIFTCWFWLHPSLD